MSAVDEALIEKVREFGAKAGCMHTQIKAHRLWDGVRDFLTVPEQHDVRVAWNHHILGEGRAELDTLLKEIIKRIRRE